MMLDYVIIGGGIASMYFAYELQKHHPDQTYIILEKDSQVGGRIKTRSFQGQEVVLGAGVGRVKKDKNLKRLMNELGIPIKQFQSNVNYKLLPYASPHVESAVKELIEAYRSTSSREIFSSFAKKILGARRYDEFIKSVGYSDYEYADVYDTLFNYGFDDTYNGARLFTVPWKLLIEKLLCVIGPSNICYKHSVTNITSQENTFNITCSNKRNFQCKKVVCGTPISHLRRLFTNNIYDSIRSQPFIRVYVQIKPNKPFEDLVSTYSVVSNDLQKIIPISPEKRIYMVAYADNDHARRLKAVMKKDKNTLEDLVKTATGIPIEIRKVSYKYWEEGTHYYTPLENVYRNRNEFIKKAQHPLRNAYVIGEAVSIHQGWVEGALESVEKIFKIDTDLL